MLRWERRLRQVGVCALAAFALSVGCGDHDLPPHSNDGGSRRADAGSDEGDAAPSVVLAPSGAALSPAETVMTSGRFRLVGTMGVGSDARSASESFELRGASISRP